MIHLIIYFYTIEFEESDNNIEEEGVEDNSDESDSELGRMMIGKLNGNKVKHIKFDSDNEEEKDGMLISNNHIYHLSYFFNNKNTI